MERIDADLEIDELTEEEFLEALRDADRWMLCGDLHSMRIEIYVWKRETRKNYVGPSLLAMKDPQSFLVEVGKMIYNLKEAPCGETSTTVTTTK